MQKLLHQMGDTFHNDQQNGDSNRNPLYLQLVKGDARGTGTMSVYLINDHKLKFN